MPTLLPTLSPQQPQRKRDFKGRSKQKIMLRSKTIDFFSPE
jgi:hypothetical protein